MFYTIFQFVTSCWTHMQQSRIENWVLDTVSKNFVILAFLTKISIILQQIALWQEIAAKSIGIHTCIGKSVY